MEPNKRIASFTKTMDDTRNLVRPQTLPTRVRRRDGHVSNSRTRPPTYTPWIVYSGPSHFTIPPLEDGVISPEGPLRGRFDYGPSQPPRPLPNLNPDLTSYGKKTEWV